MESSVGIYRIILTKRHVDKNPHEEKKRRNEIDI